MLSYVVNHHVTVDVHNVAKQTLFVQATFEYDVTNEGPKLTIKKKMNMTIVQ